MSIKHNLFYKTWVDWPGVYIATPYSKYKRRTITEKERKKLKEKYL
jgi:hypothetical protein